MPVYHEKNKKRWTKDGRSYYFKCYYTDVYGIKKPYKSKMYKLSKEAKEAEREFLSKNDREDDKSSNISFLDVYSEWLSYKRKKVKSTTFYSVVKRSEFHIVPVFSKYKLHSIKFNLINQWITHITNLNITTGHKNTLIRTLKEILIYAMNNYDYSPKIVEKIQLFKIEDVIKKATAETNFWTLEDFNTFIKSVDNNFYFIVFNFLYYTGLRSGEMIALTWEDIDFKRKQVRVNKTFTNKVLEDTYKITTPKTTNSIRYVDLDDDLVKLLENHKKHEEKIYNFKTNWYVFGNVKYLPPTTLRRYLNKYIKLAKVKRITLHGFRHSHVSLLINLGCDSRDVAERIGDTIQMVERTYYHMFPTKKKETINLLNNLKNIEK